MSNIFTDAFDAIGGALGDAAKATMNYRTGSMSVAFASGVEGMHVTDETGSMIGKTATARYKLVDDPAVAIKERDMVTIIAGDAPAQSMRVVGRFDSAGLVRLTLIAEFE